MLKLRSQCCEALFPRRFSTSSVHKCRLIDHFLGMHPNRKERVCRNNLRMEAAGTFRCDRKDSAMSAGGTDQVGGTLPRPYGDEELGRLFPGESELARR